MAQDGITTSVSAHAATDDGTAASSRQPTRATSSSSDLPAEGIPLANTYDHLVRLSNAGSSAASMRLFSDLTKCKNRAAKMAFLNYYSFSPTVDDRTVVSQPADGLGPVRQAAKKSLDELDSTDELCHGITTAQTDQRGEYLRQAALQNDPEAMVCYATSYELGPRYLSDAWFDYASRWQQEAPYFAQKAFDAGQTDILLPLIGALAPDDPDSHKTYRLSEVVKPNQQLAYALALLYLRLVPTDQLEQARQQAAYLSRGLHPDELAEARSTTDSLWPRFAHSRGDKRATTPCPEFVFPEIPLE